MDKSTHQMFIEEILSIVTGLLCNHLSAPAGFLNNTTITSAYIFFNVFRKLNWNKFNLCSPESIIILITIISHITQVLLAYQRNKENRWNDTPSLPEISLNFLATSAPAIITYFQQYRLSRSQSNNSSRHILGQEAETITQNVSNLRMNLRTPSFPSGTQEAGLATEINSSQHDLTQVQEMGVREPDPSDPKTHHTTNRDTQKNTTQIRRPFF